MCTMLMRLKFTVKCWVKCAGKILITTPISTMIHGIKRYILLRSIIMMTGICITCAPLNILPLLCPISKFLSSRYFWIWSELSFQSGPTRENYPPTVSHLLAILQCSHGQQVPIISPEGKKHTSLETKGFSLWLQRNPIWLFPLFM